MSYHILVPRNNEFITLLPSSSPADHEESAVVYHLVGVAHLPVLLRGCLLRGMVHYHLPDHRLHSWTQRKSTTIVQALNLASINVLRLPFQGITDLLLQGIQFPHYCAQGMMECRSLF